MSEAKNDAVPKVCVSAGAAMTAFDPIHAICVRIRDKPCELCPAEEPSPYGPMTRACRWLAIECANIAKHGNPWGADTPEGTVQRWQKDFNAE